jgi:hypothetical protein
VATHHTNPHPGRNRSISRRIHLAIERESWIARQGCVSGGLPSGRFPALEGLMDAAVRSWDGRRSAQSFVYVGKTYSLSVTNLDRLIVSDPSTGQDLVGKFVGYWF